MKFNITFLLFIFISININAQQFIDKAFIFDAFSDEEGIEVVQSSDNSYFLIGNSNSYAAGEASIIIIKTDSLGNLIFRKTLNTNPGFIEKVNSAVILNDIIYIAGYTQTQKFAYQALLYLVDINGNVLRNKNFGGIDFDFFNDIAAGKNNQIILAGFTYSFGNGDADAFAMICNNLGDSISAKTFGGNQKDVFTSLSTFNNKIVFAGFTKSIGNGSENAFIQFSNYQLDSLNSFIDTSHTDVSIRNILITNDTNISYVANIKDSSNVYHAPIIAKVDTNANLIWEIVSNLIDGKNIFVNTHIQLDNDQYIIAGWRDVYSVGKKDIFVSMRNSNGFFVKGEGVGGAEDDICNAIAKNRTGNLLMIGSSRSFGAQQSAIYFSVFDENLNIPKNPDSVWVNIDYDSFMEQSNYTIYPNPANDFIEIINHKVDKINYFTFYNAIGKAILKGEFTSQQRIDLKDYKSGIYFLKIEKDTNSYTYKFIIE